MTRINPFILQSLRRRKGWSQDQLADMAGVNKQTISRLERGKQNRTNENTIKLLARALGAEPPELTRQAPTLERDEREPVRRRSQSGFGLSDAGNNFLFLIAERYFIKPWQVLELAPLLFCWAAEMSLRERRERLKKLEEMRDTARALEAEMPHLPNEDFACTDAKIEAESGSIEAHDIFGMCFADDAFPEGPFDPHHDDTDNPFAMFLAKLIEDIGDVATFEGFSPIDWPIFEVCREEALNMAGGDETLADRIRTGIVNLCEMPKELQNTFLKREERTAWMHAQVDAFNRRQIEALERRKETKEAAS